MTSTVLIKALLRSYKELVEIESRRNLTEGERNTINAHHTLLAQMGVDTYEYLMTGAIIVEGEVLNG